MKKFIIILTFFLLFINCANSAQQIVSKDIKAVTQDGFSINARLDYPKNKTQKEFSTVVLLHSLGYSSEWWGNLPEDLISEGYAVLRIDLRGHGKSTYNAQLVRNSWKNMTNNAYAKYPEDVIKVIEQVKVENSKKEFFKNWAIVGADIGASTGIIASDLLSVKPRTIVMLSPVVKSKGLYIPVRLAHLDNVDILAISGTNDLSGENAQKYLKKFAQAEFTTYTSTSRSTGMMLIRNDDSLSQVITQWIKEYLH